MTEVEGRTRRWVVLAAVPIGILLFVLALFSTGAGHGSYWAVIAFYPLQFLSSAVAYDALDARGSDLAFVVLSGVLSLPWYPLLVYLFTSKPKGPRLTAIALVVLQIGAAVILAARL